jgi:hypothetical protein
MKIRRDRLHTARRTGFLERLVSQDRIPRERAERLVAEWEREAERRSLDPVGAEYWRDAELWVRGRMKRPPAA